MYCMSRYLPHEQSIILILLYHYHAFLSFDDNLEVKICSFSSDNFALFLYYGVQLHTHTLQQRTTPVLMFIFKNPILKCERIKDIIFLFCILAFIILVHECNLF